jgi:hypothetical protein
VASRNRSSPPCSPDRLRWHRSDPPHRLRPARDPGTATGSPAPLKRRGAPGFGFGPPCRRLAPPASAADERVNHRRDSIGPRRHGLPRRLGLGPSKAELRLDRKGLTGTGIAGMVRIARDLEGDHEAHGRNERQVAGNGDMDATDSSAEQRLEVGCSVGFRRASRLPTSVERAPCTERLLLRLQTRPEPPSGGSDAVPAVQPPGASQLPVVARLPANAPVLRHEETQGDSHATTTGASASSRGVCSVMWGSASADRSLTASDSLPRTPSPAFGFGPRSFRACRRGSSEPRRLSRLRRNPPSRRVRSPSAPRGALISRLVTRAYAPRTSGDRGRRGHRLRPALPAEQDGNDRKATVAVMRIRLLTRGTLRRVRNAPREPSPTSRPPSGDQPVGPRETR